MNMFPHFGRINNNYINCQNKSEMNTSSQKVDVIVRGIVLSTLEFFTNRAHVRIIVDNAM